MMRSARDHVKTQYRLGLRRFCVVRCSGKNSPQHGFPALDADDKDIKKHLVAQDGGGAGPRLVEPPSAGTPAGTAQRCPSPTPFSPPCRGQCRPSLRCRSSDGSHAFCSTGCGSRYSQIGSSFSNRHRAKSVALQPLPLRLKYPMLRLPRLRPLCGFPSVFAALTIHLLALEKSGAKTRPALMPNGFEGIIKAQRIGPDSAQAPVAQGIEQRFPKP